MSNTAMFAGRRNSSRIAGLTLAVLVTGGLVSVTGPAASAAPLCALDAGGHALAVAAQSGGFGVTIKASPPYLDVNDTHCALLDGVDSVSIDMSANPGFILFDLRGGPLAPGYTDEGNGSSEIEFQVSGVDPARTEMRVEGSSGNDGITLGQFILVDPPTGQINLNATTDVSPDADVGFTGLPHVAEVFANEGDDSVSLAGIGDRLSRALPVPGNLADGPGADLVTGGPLDDSVSGDVDAGTGFDTWSGGGGDDTFLARCDHLKSPIDYGSITLDDAANDGVGCPSSGCDNVRSDFENVYGCGANETIVGDANANILEGGGGTDVLEAEGGDDTLVADECSCTQTFRGGDGTDTVSFARFDSDPVFVRMDAFANDGGPGQGSFVESDVENIIGSPQDDAIYGDAGPNRLSGVDGNDDIRGAGGNDTILPGIGGTTTTTGGGGIDTLSYSDLANCSQLRLTIDTAAHTVDSSNASLCFLSDLHQTFSSFESFVGSRYKDVFDGGPANDTFHGGGSADSLFGRAGDDSLYGQGGNDTLNGGIGVDVCAQGPGSGNVVNCES